MASTDEEYSTLGERMSGRNSSSRGDIIDDSSRSTHTKVAVQQQSPSSAHDSTIDDSLCNSRSHSGPSRIDDRIDVDSSDGQISSSDASIPDNRHYAPTTCPGPSHEPKESPTRARQPEHASKPSKMKGARREIALAIALLLIPLLLSAALIYLTYANLQPRNSIPGVGFQDTITLDDEEHELSDKEYYVHYSATQLVFISSLLSTLALALVPVGMYLFAYTTASSFQKASGAMTLSRLPSPYQLELLMRLLGGSTIELYRCLKYLMRFKQKRASVTPMLQRAALLFVFLLLHALGITIVDALLHTGTSTVQYNSLNPYVASDFNPGRRLPPDCLVVPDRFTQSACNIRGLRANGGITRLSNSSEAYLLMGNTSASNDIRLADDGKTAVIVPKTLPPRLRFTARSYASSTICRMVTALCDPHFNGDATNAGYSIAFNCTPANSGITLSGNFTDSSDLRLDFYSTASKEQNTTSDPNFDYTNSSTFDGKIWSGAVFALQSIDFNFTQLLNESVAYDPDMNLVTGTATLVYGIFSCETSLSDVTYDMDESGNVRNAILNPMNDTAGRPFFQPLALKFGNENLAAALNIVTSSAKDVDDLSYRFARAMDRTILGLTAGILSTKESARMFRSESKQVAKVPVVEFVALIVLSLILPVVGIVLGFWAFLLCKSSGVRDVQARLGIGTMVAGLFEDEKFNETATKVQELYAEFRDMPTKRVMVQNFGKEGAGKVFVAVEGREKGSE